ncbi:MAG: hypothetical protein GY805_19110 [Chloroflexi bacterium]|nr:hypothetical protein [Chloroflexota bacterium]
MIPYLLMILLYLSLAILAALESSFSSLQLISWFNGVVWLRIHLVTLGVLTQIFFYIMPKLAAIKHRLPNPNMRWDIWLTLNGGILTLLVGIPLVSKVPIIIGGTLIFIATALLTLQLWGMKPSGAKESNGSSSGRKFYIAGLAYFLVGIIVGTGLFIGWSEPLGITGNAKEVHIHANNWGLMSLLFAGLLIDMYPTWTKRPLANPNSTTAIFWLMTLGAFGLIFGPWFQNRYLLVPGLVMHLVATFWLLINAIQPLRGDKPAWTVGIWHLISSYFWILAPVFMAPFVLFGVGDLPGATIEATAPQPLVYGWLLQFGYAIIPYFFTRIFTPDEEAKLGGTWFSFVTINVGGIFLWASIFASSISSTLSGIGYLLWAISMLPIAVTLWRTMQTGMARLESDVSLQN